MLTPRRRTRFALPAALLLFFGVLLCGLYKVTNTTEKHSFASGSTPPSVVVVTADRTYQLAVHGGVQALQKRGVDVHSPQCAWSVDGSATQALGLEPGGPDTKATNTVATFVAPVTGAIHVDCAGWGAVFIDDADNASGDEAGVFLLGGVIALTLGAILGLAAARQAVDDASGRSFRQDDEVERFIDIDILSRSDPEVGGSNRGDVGE